jgi:hypothetical protein
MPERHTITLELTDTQVRALRQAAYDYADGKYAARMERLATVSPTIQSDLHPSPLELAAWELTRRVEKATAPLMEEVSRVPSM